MHREAQVACLVQGAGQCWSLFWWAGLCEMLCTVAHGLHYCTWPQISWCCCGRLWNHIVMQEEHQKFPFCLSVLGHLAQALQEHQEEEPTKLL